MELHFKGPYHFNNIDKIEFDEHKKGIYIWGFVYEYNKSQIGKAKEYNDDNVEKIYSTEDDIFIPYYVGIDSSLNAFIRIKEHHNLFSNTSKYIRFNEIMMKEFFLGNTGLPIHFFKNDTQYFTNLKDWINDPNNKEKRKVTYINNKEIMELIYGKGNIFSAYPGINKSFPFKKNDPCYCVKVKDSQNTVNCIDDQLAELIGNKNNFWFTYAFVDSNLEKTKLEELEALVFWKLKGLTVSVIKKNISESIINNTIIRSDKNLKHIFKEEKFPLKPDKVNNEIWQKENKNKYFPGYL